MSYSLKDLAPGDLVFQAPLVSVVMAGVVGAVRFRNLPLHLRYLVGLIAFALLMEVISRAQATSNQSNLFLSYLDTSVEFGLLAWMYRQVLRPSRLSRWIPAVVAVFSLASLLPYLGLASLSQFNTFQRFAESLLVLGLVLAYFHKTIRELLIIHLEREPMFWVSVGLLLYFSGNVFIFISSNYVIQHSRALSIKMWAIHALLYIILNALYAVALWISPSSKK